MSDGTPHPNPNVDEKEPEAVAQTYWGDFGAPRDVTALRDSNIPLLLEPVIELGNGIGQLWNTFVAFSGVVIGWLYAKDKPLEPWQCRGAFVLYGVFVLVNFWTIHKMYTGLGNTLASMRAEAGRLEASDPPHFGRAMRSLFIPGCRWREQWDKEPYGNFAAFYHGGLGYVAYITIVVVVVLSIWFKANQPPAPVELKEAAKAEQTQPARE
ncbi:MAG TPA: hypothetical protein VER08_00400 [Pyrinomonadaceae bacterium]|nr:hypothetical protein [Pyrinomonadaceae bacterium]